MTRNPATAIDDPRLIRTFMESPILDDRKWAKVQTLRFDALMVDLEDTVSPERKGEARERAVAALDSAVDDPTSTLIPRVNSLDSGFFDADIAVLARTPLRVIAYPKLQSAAELTEVLDRLAAVGLTPDVFASVESAAGVQAVDEFAAHPRVRGLLFGPADLGLDMGIPLDAAKDLTSPALQYARSRVVMAAAANRLACITMAFPDRMTDLDETRRHVLHARALGFTGMMTFYPPHLDIIHSAFTPSDADVAKATESVEVYTRARDQGLATAYLASGDLVLAFDYEAAKSLLRRHAAFEGDAR